MCVTISLLTVLFSLSCKVQSQLSHTDMINIFPDFPGLRWDFFTPQIIQHPFKIV